MTLQGISAETITLYIGVITTLTGILATALQGKKLSEKEEEMLIENWKQDNVMEENNDDNQC